MNDGNDRPRSEPEILPPERDAFGRNQWPQSEFPGFRYVHVRRIGPFGLFLGALAAAVIVAIAAFVVAGFLLFVVPVVLAMAVISIGVVLLRAYLGRPSGR